MPVMPAPEGTAPPPTLRALWAQFLPLSLSDVTMMAGDPLITGTLAQLPEARLNLAAVGIAKALAIFFESPIIMVLHASNVLAASAASRRALWRFVLLAMGLLSGLMALLAVPAVFSFVAGGLLGIEGAVAARGRVVVLLMLLWPAAIAWRRYFQGHLIRAGRPNAVAQAGLVRLGVVMVVLAAGFTLSVPGYMLAAVALVGGVIFEALLVTYFARRETPGRLPEAETAPGLPVDLAGVWRFYWPLANSSLVVWGGRAVLVAIVARAVDAPIALAAWPAAWGFVLLVANATRMVQQVIIRQRGVASDRLLMGFALSVGGACSALLAAIAVSPPGLWLLSAFVGHDAALVAGVQPVVLLSAAVPLVIAMLSAVQGFMIGEGRTGRVNAGAWIGTFTLLAVAWWGVGSGYAGASAAAAAMVAALTIETLWLALGLRLPTEGPSAAA